MGRQVRWVRFCREVVEEFLAGLPDLYKPYLDNVVIDILDEPSPIDWREVGVDPAQEPDEMLFGLFTGVPVGEQQFGVREPNRIKVFLNPLLSVSRDSSEMKQILTDTLLHELAHHFGFSEEDLERFESTRRRPE